MRFATISLLTVIIKFLNDAFATDVFPIDGKRAK